MKFFFTFGSNPRYPYGRDEFVEVHTDTGDQAAQKFKLAFPCRPGSTLQGKRPRGRARLKEGEII